MVVRNKQILVQARSTYLTGLLKCVQPLLSSSYATDLMELSEILPF